jgi:hypothetical protein
VRAPRLVATDLDGTLLRSDGTVSERTARLLADVERAGVAWAVGNAHPDVLAAASRHCAANDEDGVADIFDLVLQMV